jgi:hypothetical protein
MSEFRTIVHKSVEYQVVACGVVSPYVAKRRPNLLTSIEEDQVKRAMRFLRECAVPHKRKKGYSYTLKHVAEDYTGDYVSNGALIEAALRLGYRVVPIDPLSINADVYLEVQKWPTFKSRELQGGILDNFIKQVGAK